MRCASVWSLEHPLISKPHNRLLKAGKAVDVFNLTGRIMISPCLPCCGSLAGRTPRRDWSAQLFEYSIGWFILYTNQVAFGLSYAGITPKSRKDIDGAGGQQCNNGQRNKRLNHR